MDETKTGAIYIDCTNTVFTGLNTGIQRVVRNIVQRLSTDIHFADKKLVPVVAVMGCFYKFDADISKKLFWTKLLSNVFASCRNLLNYLFMNKYSEGDWPIDIINTKPDVIDIHGNVVHSARKIIPIIYKLAYRADGVIVGEEIKFTQYDILFLSDAFWKDSIYKSICNIKASGVKLMMLIYDLIPVTHPTLFDNVNQSSYIKCLNELLDNVRGVISISKSSLADIESYISNAKSGVHFDYFYLGADFSAVGRISGDIRTELKTTYVSGSVYLAVGTIEPRKNHNYLLDAFQKLWEQGYNIKLCIVGRVGWKCDDILKRIETSTEIGERLFHFENLNDDELAYCYHKSKAVICSSIIEGFGLPIVEAMHYGKPVFASDISVFREIGKEYPVYFELADSSSLAGIITSFENGLLDRNFAYQKWLTWDESIDDLLKKVVDMAKKIS